MIKANEIRIGNLVNFNDDGNIIPLRVKYIGCDVEGFKGYFLNLEKGISTSIEDHFKDGDIDVTGIPLTEEYLLKFGFEKHQSIIAASYSKSISYSGSLKELVVFIDKGNEYIHIREGERSYPTTADTITTLLNGDYNGRPFYVHQLQNLFYSLTGQELTFKETLNG